MGFWNVGVCIVSRRSYMPMVQRKIKDPVLNVHHIESRKAGGDSPSNLMTLCKTCHDMIHREGLEHEIQRRFSSLKDVPHDSDGWFIWNGLKKVYPHANITYGYITKCIRNANRLPKSHMVDARCISGNPLAKSGTVYLLKFVRKTAVDYIRQPS